MKGWVSKSEHAKDTGCLRCTKQIRLFFSTVFQQQKNQARD
jgi:hypothetical protein